MTLELSETSLEFWAERDRIRVALIGPDGATIVEWRGTEALDAFDAGYLSDAGFFQGRLVDSAPLHASAFEYAAMLRMLPETSAA